jgi:hypothetical protein
MTSVLGYGFVNNSLFRDLYQKSPTEQVNDSPKKKQFKLQTGGDLSRNLNIDRT